ncbi:MAG: amidohydrolase, partial [Pseudomonadales bacterium]|nr:amidohydrolase [Pseudomonadales bacterium]
PLEAGSGQVNCILDTEQSLSEIKSIVKSCVDQSTREDWLLGWGHSLETLLGSAQTPREVLDAMNSSQPIAIMEATSHSVWVNSKALEIAGIDASTVQPTGGIIMKDAKGQPNGILLDAAGDLVFDLAYTPTPELMQSNYEGLLYGLEQVAQNGITSVVDARVYWKRGYLDVWKRAVNENRLTARTALSLWAYPSVNDAEQLAKLKTMYSNDPDSLLRANQIKFYSDGIIHNTTAALLKPYLEHIEEVGSYGLNYFDKNRLALYTTELEKVGFDMHIHAIGDRGVQESLDAIEAAQQTNGKNSTRHRLTHIEMVSDADKPRFAELGAIADFQLAGDFTKPENANWMEPLIGNRAYEMLPVKDIYETGATVTLSSDWDVSSLSPFVGMQNALTRGDQSLPNLDAVIKAYTINGAYTMRQEERTGSIEVGKFGDLVIVDQNIFEVDVNNIGKTKVLMTILGGNIVFNSGAF